jgi:D-alanyl-D-alanine carboxypeptidase
VIAEVESERILYQENPHEIRHPASLTKMMTLYLVFDALARHKISLSDTLWASRHCTSRPPSKLGLKVGDAISVEQGVLALVTQSANDAATAIAEGLAGSEEAFADIMTRKARQLGMRNTVFRNASGLPDPEQVTTAWDMFRLGKALIKDFPQYYRYFSTRFFDFRGRTFDNHNHLMDRYYGVDGIKTGFINASGFNLVASARRNGHRLIGVVFGGPTARKRDEHMAELLDDGFAQLDGLPKKQYLATLDAFSPAAPMLRRPEDARTALLDRSSDAYERYAAGATRLQEQRPRSLRDSRTIADWQIRLGEFPHEQGAELQLYKVRKYAPGTYRQARINIKSRRSGGRLLYVAYLSGITKNTAEQTCQVLKRNGVSCALLPASG